MKSYNEMNYVEYNRNLVLFLLFCLMVLNCCVFLYMFLFFNFDCIIYKFIDIF